MANETYIKEWEQICAAYCQKVNAELLFVNTDNFGVQYKDGSFRHIYADELALMLEGSGTDEISE